MTFTLDTKLEADSDFVCDLTLCQVRLIKNAAFPWILLIPRQNGIVELTDLSVADQEQMLREIRQAMAVMGKLYSPTKLNIANLGNVVAQHHFHVIARFDTDKAWPNPVWNSGVKEEYSAEALQKSVDTLRKSFV